MPLQEHLGELYVSIRADYSRLRDELRRVKDLGRESAGKLEREFASVNTGGAVNTVREISESYQGLDEMRTAADREYYLAVLPALLSGRREQEEAYGKYVESVEQDRLAMLQRFADAELGIAESTAEKKKALTAGNDLAFLPESPSAFDTAGAFTETDGLYDGDLEAWNALQEMKLESSRETQAVMSEEMMQFRDDAVDIYDSMAAGLAGFWREALLSTSNANSMLEQAFVSMANSFIRQVQRMVSEWLVMRVITGIGGALLAPVTGGASFAAASAVAAAASAAPGFSSGGDFIVPPGYPNDSYPIRVESGERVTVTPASEVQASRSASGFPAQVLPGTGEIVKAINAMNLNLVQKDFSVNVTNAIDGREMLTGGVKPAENRLRKGGMNLDEL